MRKRIGWLHRYIAMAKNSANGRSRTSLIIKLGIAILGMYILFAIGFYLMVFMTEIAFKQYFLPPNMQYAENLIRTFIIIETMHYLFFRSRTSLRFFWIFSFCANIIIFQITASYQFYATFYFINLHLLLQLFLIFSFLFLEKMIMDDEMST